MPSLLDSLPEAELRRVRAAMVRRKFSKGTVVFHEGDPGASCHLVVSGRFAVSVATPTMMSTLVPAKPRKSWLGRFTHCTGMRSGAASAPTDTGTVSRWSSSALPRYHGVAAERETTLSPCTADTGIAVTCVKPSRSARSRYSASMVRNTRSS